MAQVGEGTCRCPETSFPAIWPSHRSLPELKSFGLGGYIRVLLGLYLSYIVVILGFYWRSIGVILGVYLEGQGGSVSRLITPITRIVTLLIPIINLRTKSP